MMMPWNWQRAMNALTFSTAVGVGDSAGVDDVPQLDSSSALLMNKIRSAILDRQDILLCENGIHAVDGCS